MAALSAAFVCLLELFFKGGAISSDKEAPRKTSYIDQ
jgi:hypothetical protein